MKCEICDKETGKKLCSLHMQAYLNLVDKFAVWRKGLKISWKHYLREIEKHSLTGEWAKEVAKHLIEGEVEDGKEI